MGGDQDTRKIVPLPLILLIPTRTQSIPVFLRLLLGCCCYKKEGGGLIIKMSAQKARATAGKLWKCTRVQRGKKRREGVRGGVVHGPFFGVTDFVHFPTLSLASCWTSAVFPPLLYHPPLLPSFFFFFFFYFVALEGGRCEPRQFSASGLVEVVATRRWLLRRRNIPQKVRGSIGAERTRLPLFPIS